MDQEQKIIINEIKKLEDKFKEGNKSKVKTGTMIGVGVAAIGAVASVLYTPETLITSIPFEPLAQLLIANAGMALLTGGGGYYFTKGKKEATVKLNNAYTDRVSNFLLKIKDAKPDFKTEFLFNLESTLYPTYQRKTELQVKLDAEVQAKKVELKLTENEQAILPLNMANYIKEINKTFLHIFNKTFNKRPTIETINISNAELTDNQLGEMLAFGIGCCGTKKLILSKNRLDLKSVQHLKKHIVKKKHAFHSLKILDLSDNNLPEESLEDLKDIVRYLGIEELNISGNPFNRDISNFNYISPALKKFLEFQPASMPTLKVLKLAGINLTNNFSKTLNIMISKPSILASLDITNNPNLGSEKLQKLFEKGYKINQSLQELLVDQREGLYVDDIIKKKENKYQEMRAFPEQFGDVDAPGIVYLLNRFFRKKHLNLDVKEFLDEPLLPLLEQLSEMIMKVRMQILQIPKDYSIPVTEKEFVRLMNNDLNLFYIDIVKEEDATVLDPRLFVNQERILEIKDSQPTVYLKDKKKAEELKTIQASDRYVQGLKKAF